MAVANLRGQRAKSATAGPPRRFSNNSSASARCPSPTSAPSCASSTSCSLRLAADVLRGLNTEQTIPSLQRCSPMHMRMQSRWLRQRIPATPNARRIPHRRTWRQMMPSTPASIPQHTPTPKPRAVATIRCRRVYRQRLHQKRQGISAAPSEGVSRARQQWPLPNPRTGKSSYRVPSQQISRRHRKPR